jgi:glutamyl-tRNA reductase
MSFCSDDICRVAPDTVGPAYTVVGASHRKTPLALREKLSITNGELTTVLGRLHTLEHVSEVAVVSTCNRVEVYAVGDGAGSDIAPEIIATLCEAKHIDRASAIPAFYFHCGAEAIRHLFRVVCGLDSMVPGENEVLGQVKAAYLSAVEAETVDASLSRLFQRAFNVAKDVRTTTEIAKRKVSVATLVADLSKRVFDDLARTSAAMIGAGHMAELTLKVLAGERVNVAVVANRSTESATRLAEPYGARVISLDEIRVKALDVDIIISSTSAPEPFITPTLMLDAIRARKGRPMLLVDLGVPRNIDPAVGKMDGAILYDIDDLQRVVSANVAYRLEQAEMASAIIETSVGDFTESLHIDSVAETISDLCAELERISADECDRALGRLADLSEDQRGEVSQMAHRIVNKILHTPIAALKDTARTGDGHLMQRSARKLFGL